MKMKIKKRVEATSAAVPRATEERGQPGRGAPGLGKGESGREGPTELHRDSLPRGWLSG